MTDDRPRQDDRTPQADDCLAAADLLRGRKMVRIRHEGEIYVLRVTRSGKLILTK